MVKQTAHDSSDECSNHSSLNLYTRLMVKMYFLCYYKSPSAGIGRQSELKIRWYITVNVQVVSWIMVTINGLYVLIINHLKGRKIIY